MNYYFSTAFHEERVSELVEQSGAALTARLSLIAEQLVASVLADTRHYHALHGWPVIEQSLESASTETRRLQIVIGHVRISAESIRRRCFSTRRS